MTNYDLIKPRRSVLPLSLEERGRGVVLEAARRVELEDFCWLWVKDGKPQNELCGVLNATRSRVSRWTKAGFDRLGLWNERRHLNTQDLDLPGNAFAADRVL